MSNLATITNNILADSGIDDINVIVSTGSYANPAWITSLAWTKITGAPTSIVTGTGTTNTLPKFTGASTIGNSSISDSGALVTTPLTLAIGDSSGATGLNIIRGRLCFSNSYEANHTIYNNSSNIDGEGAWDGMKMNVYLGLRIRTGTAAGEVPTQIVSVVPTGVDITGALNVSSTGLFQGNSLTVGSAVAATNVELNINGVANKAGRIQFQQSGVSSWLMGNGAASENGNFEIYNSNGQQALTFIKATSAATFISTVTANRFISNATDNGSGEYYFFNGNAAVSNNLTIYSYSSTVYNNAYSGYHIRSNSTGGSGGYINLHGSSIMLGSANSPILHGSHQGVVIQGSGRGILEIWDATSGKSVFQNVSGDTYIGQLDKGTGFGRTFLLVNGVGTSADVALTLNADTTATFNSSVGVGGVATNRLTVFASQTGTQATTIPVAKFLNTGNEFSKLVIGSDNANYDGVISMDNNATLANTKLRFYIGNGTGATAGHSNDQLVLQGNGNVGIGTASNIFGKLSVEATGNHITLRAPGATAGKYWALDVTTANQFYLLNNTGSQFLTITDAGAATFSSSLNVGGVTDIQATRTAQLTLLKLSTNTLSSDINDEISIDFGRGGMSFFSGRISGYISNFATYDGGLKFYTSTSGTLNATPSLTLTPSGSVGIGTTSIASKLTIYEGDIRLWKRHLNNDTPTWKANINFTDELDRLGARITGERTAWDGAPMALGFDTGGLNTVARRLTITSEGTVRFGSNNSTIIGADGGNGYIYSYSSGNPTIYIEAAGVVSFLNPNGVFVNTTTRWNQERFGIQISNSAGWSTVPAMMRLTNYVSGGMTKITFTDSSIIDGWLGMVPVGGASYFVMGFSGATEQGFKLYQNGNLVISGSTTASSFFESSDKRLKSNILDLDVNVNSIIAKTYLKNGVEEIGYLAQDVESILPSAVSKRDDGYLDLSYRQVHTAKIAYLEKRIKQLEEKYENNSKRPNLGQRNRTRSEDS